MGERRFLRFLVDRSDFEMCEMNFDILVEEIMFLSS
jgi:hypothetical protein